MYVCVCVYEWEKELIFVIFVYLIESLTIVTLKTETNITRCDYNKVQFFLVNIKNDNKR